MSALAPVIDLAAHRQRVDELVAEHAGWAKRLVGRFNGNLSRAVAEDLKAAAMIGLWQAARRYEPSKGAFQVFAYPRVLGAIRDEQRKADRLSRTDRRRVSLLTSVSDDLTAAHRRHPSRPELAQALGVSARRVEDLLHAEHVSAVVSLELLTAWQDKLAEDEQAPDRLGELERLARETLSGRELECVLWTVEGINLAEIGARWGRTESRACQILGSAKKKLRKAALRAGLIEGSVA